MIKPIFYLALPFIAINLKSQPNYFIGLDTIKAPKNLENTSIIPLFHDTINVSSFLIFINKEVKLHKHITHDEQVYVIEGEGQMQLGEKIKEIGPKARLNIEEVLGIKIHLFLFVKVRKSWEDNPELYHSMGLKF